MENFNPGDHVSWVKKMACVPHQEGKTDRDGNVLPIFRDIIVEGKIIRVGGKKDGELMWYVRPNDAEKHKDRICGEDYYDIKINEKDIIKK